MNALVASPACCTSPPYTAEANLWERECSKTKDQPSGQSGRTWVQCVRRKLRRPRVLAGTEERAQPPSLSQTLILRRAEEQGREHEAVRGMQGQGFELVHI